MPPHQIQHTMSSNPITPQDVTHGPSFFMLRVPAKKWACEALLARPSHLLVHKAAGSMLELARTRTTDGVFLFFYDSGKFHETVSFHPPIFSNVDVLVRFVD